MNLRKIILIFAILLPATFSGAKKVKITLPNRPEQTAVASSDSATFRTACAKEAEAAGPGGAYIFVPDSLQGDVLRLLDGHSKVVDDQNRLDLNEKTIHKGDTVPMVLKSLNLGRYDRGLSNFLYVPKGTWQIGLTASYGELDIQKLDIFGLLSDVTMGARAFSIKPYVQYFIKNNMALGLKFGYTNMKGTIDSFKVDIDEDINFNLSDIMYRSESYSSALTFTQYLGLTRKGRFGVFNEVELSFQTGNSEFTRPYNGELTTTYTATTETQINFSPGVQVFIMKNAAFHVSFGVFGFYLKNEKQWENDEPSGSRFSSGANFRFNIFNINFGIAVAI